eukprot:m51a1_g3031 hypothetical protein (474) ;mRNA; f:904444-906070
MTRKEIKRRRQQKAAKEVEAAAHARAEAEIDSGRTDASLFFVDKGAGASGSARGGKKQWQERVLRRDRNVRPKAPEDPEAKARRKKAFVKDEVAGLGRTAAKRLHDDVVRHRELDAAKHAKTRPASFDLWSAPKKNEWIPQENPMKHPSATYVPSTLPAVALPAPGESYRPREDDHQELVVEAEVQRKSRDRAAKYHERQLTEGAPYARSLMTREDDAAHRDLVKSFIEAERNREIELRRDARREAALEQREKKRQRREAAQQPKQKQKADKGEAAAQEPPKKKGRHPMFEDFKGKPGEIKTRIQRNRELRVRKAVQLELKRAARKKKERQWLAMGKTLKRIETRAARREQEKEAKKLDEIDRMAAPKHIGPHPMINAPKIVIPTDKLTSLRTLPMDVQRGLAREMFRRLQKRNIVERNASNSATSENRKKLAMRREVDRENRMTVEKRKFKYSERASARLPLSDPLTKFLTE